MSTAARIKPSFGFARDKKGRTGPQLLISVILYFPGRAPRRKIISPLQSFGPCYSRKGQTPCHLESSRATGTVENFSRKDCAIMIHEEREIGCQKESEIAFVGRKQNGTFRKSPKASLFPSNGNRYLLFARWREHILLINF